MAVTTRVTVSGADVLLHTPKWASTGAGCRGIIAGHGHGGNAFQIDQGMSWAGHPEYWADRGYAVACISTGDTWDQATGAMTPITNLYNYLTGTVGISGTKVGIAGWSMGGGNVLRWLLENSAKVAAGYLFSPASDLDYVEAQAAWTAQVDALYGGSHANYLTQGSPRSPLNNAATFRGGPKLCIAHATDDATLPYSMATGFVAAVGDAAVSLRSPDVTGGHQGALLNVPPRETWEWFRAQWAA